MDTVVLIVAAADAILALDEGLDRSPAIGGKTTQYQETCALTSKAGKGSGGTNTAGKGYFL